MRNIPLEPDLSSGWIISRMSFLMSEAVEDHYRKVPSVKSIMLSTESIMRPLWPCLNLEKRMLLRSLFPIIPR